MTRYPCTFFFMALVFIIGGCGSKDETNGPLEVIVGESVTTATGLIYVVQVIGGGAAPTAGKQVTVHYTGTLTDGTKFDSSVDRGEPFSFIIGVGQVIKGWDEGIMLMRVGGQRTLTIPPHLAYGDREIPGVIPAGSTLIFDVELLAVQ
ncbi:MAG: FKBP-type peptidyl-prolyl cis-trans isomerase [Candidatus Marinimicrobia bacterium]|nr:FKBP-type peptidyl-prolyl cis-trans isomerase [Candidatus Neomarinimicrobiota bacterium]